MKRLLTALFVLLAITAIVFYGMFSSLQHKAKQQKTAAAAIYTRTL